ncbi:MAG: hypothetical protein LBU87_04145 [Lactobacillales bacterium]|jgi:hypothetical protein|nr:hypothetical protein [Lactobacillales bacterium]
MKKLYHYAPKPNTVLKDGLLSISKNPVNLKPYSYEHRANSEREEDVMKWLENSFYGRSRCVSGLTEPIKWQGNASMLKGFAKARELFSFDVEKLFDDGIAEAIYSKHGHNAIGLEEKIKRITSPKEIDFSPLDWHLCNEEKGVFFGVIRHYFIVLKDGRIPPRYITKEG